MEMIDEGVMESILIESSLKLLEGYSRGLNLVPYLILKVVRQILTFVR